MCPNKSAPNRKAIQRVVLDDASVYYHGSKKVAAVSHLALFCDVTAGACRTACLKSSLVRRSEKRKTKKQGPLPQTMQKCKLVNIATM